MKPEELTDDQVIAAMDPNGATMKYGEIVAVLAHYLKLPSHLLYRYADRRLQSMKASGRVELVKGKGGGWRICDAINERAKGGR